MPQQTRPKANSEVKITVISTARDCWGAEESLITLVEQWHRAGHDLVLLSTSEELCKRWNKLLANDSAIIWRPNRTRLARVLQALGALRSAKLRGDALLIWSYELTPLSLLPRSVLRHKSVVLDLHDRLRGWRGQALLKALSRRCDQIVSNSQFSADFLSRHSYVVLTRSVDSPICDPVYGGVMEGKPFTVSVVGRIEPSKNHALALLAMNGMPEVYLSIRGSADAADIQFELELRKIAAALLQNRVQFTGRLDAACLYQGVTVLLVCNADEAMGRTVLEAAARGIPALVPHRGGSAELVEDGVTGWHYRANSAKDLRLKIQEIRKSPEWVASAGLRARTEVSRNSPESYAQKYARAIEHSISQP